jgi:predicted hydrocarbon binding protein
MKGVLFNHLEEITHSILSPQAWKELCAELPIETQEAFIANRTYPDSDLKILVEGIAQKANLAILEVWRKFGKLSISSFIKKHNQLLAPYKSVKDLLDNLNFMHFTEVRNLYTQTQLPYFIPQKSDKGVFVVRYVSARKMCFYLEGAIEGVADYFKQQLSYQQTVCVNRGASFCEFEISH